MPGYKRERTASAYEEKNVSEFVESCVNFKTNVSFASLEGAAFGSHVLIVGTEEQIKAASASLPVWDANVDLCFNNTSGTIRATWTNGKRVSVGVVTTEASRHNCAVRPDVITSIIGAAVADAKDLKSLDVIALSTEEIVVAAAIAKAQPTFTAKKGATETSYDAKPADVRVFFANPLKHKAADLESLATYVQLCQRLVDAPTNVLDTTTFAEIAASHAEKLGCTFDIIKGEELREKGYGGVYGVGKAAEFPPALVTLTYKPKGEMDPQDKIAFVGKGIVYDTGGLAIKTPATNMCGMKDDMGGAAATFTGFCAAVALGCKKELSVTLCLADNAIGPRSQRNDDIIRMKSGITVEINNTDAEGRIVLGDGVFHASSLLSFTPTKIVDMATLTGAQGIAVGHKLAGVLSNTEAGEKYVVAAGKKCGDAVFPVVFAPEYHNPEFASTVADYKNSVANRANAQVSCAGQFICNNLAKEWKGDWIHVDLAYPAVANKRGTGYGCVLAVQLAMGLEF